MIADTMTAAAIYVAVAATLAAIAHVLWGSR